MAQHELKCGSCGAWRDAFVEKTCCVWKWDCKYRMTIATPCKPVAKPPVATWTSCSIVFPAGKTAASALSGTEDSAKCGPIHS